MRGAEVIPLVRGAAKKLDRLERSQLETVYEQYRTASNEWLKRQIVDNNRIDILATVILGYDVEPYHLAMMRWQFLHPESLQLSFRGGGKTTVCTVTKAIHYLCKNRDLHILLASESKGTSAGFLREIKGHLEGNERLIEVFGPFYDPKVVAKWDTYEIDVVGKTTGSKEASITCTGVDASITSKHFEVALTDDLVVEKNSRTDATRQQVKNWYYHTYTPLIMPPKPDVEHCGEHHILGTRQCPEDLYEDLEAGELREHTQVIPALDEHENSPYPKLYPPEFFKKQRRKMGVLRFGAQYQQDVEAMRGEIFQHNDCIQLDPEEYPALSKLKVYMGVDLAVGEKRRNDMFAISVVGILGSIKKDDFFAYLLDYYLEHLRASKQEAKVIEYYDKWKPLRTGIEVNQYQDILRQTLKLSRPGMVVYPIHTSLDKVTRGQKLAPLVESHRAFFLGSGVHARPIDHLVRFPGGKGTKDYFDSYDNAIRAARRKAGRKQSDRKKFGVIGG